MKQIGAILSLIAVVAAGSAEAETKETIDLDHVAPAELLIVDGDVRTIHYWSVQNGLWLELFRSNTEIEGIADDPQSALSQIKSGGRYWQWRNDAYVPLVAEQAVIAGELDDSLFEKAAAFLGEFDEVPDNSPANMKVAIEIGGEPSIAALLGGTVFCSMGGTNCPIIIFKDGEPQSAVYVTISQPWGMSRGVNQNGYPYIESQLDHSLLLIDTETGEENGLPGIAPKQSDPQPQRPKDLPQ